MVDIWFIKERELWHKGIWFSECTGSCSRYSNQYQLLHIYVQTFMPLFNFPEWSKKSNMQKANKVCSMAFLVWGNRYVSNDFKQEASRYPPFQHIK